MRYVFEFQKLYVPTMVGLAIALLFAVGLAPEVVGRPAQLSVYYTVPPKPLLKEGVLDSKPVRQSTSRNHESGPHLVAVVPEEIKCPRCLNIVHKSDHHICLRNDLTSEEAMAGQIPSEFAIAIGELTQAQQQIPLRLSANSFENGRTLDSRSRHALHVIDQYYHGYVDQSFNAGVVSAARERLRGAFGDSAASEFYDSAGSSLKSIALDNNLLSWFSPQSGLIEHQVANLKRLALEAKPTQSEQVQFRKPEPTLNFYSITDGEGQSGSEAKQLSSGQPSGSAGNQATNYLKAGDKELETLDAFAESLAKDEWRENYAHFPAAVLWVLLTILCISLIMRSVLQAGKLSVSPFFQVLHLLCMACVPITVYGIVYSVYIKAPAIIEGDSIIYLAIIATSGFLMPTVQVVISLVHSMKFPNNPNCEAERNWFRLLKFPAMFQIVALFCCLQAHALFAGAGNSESLSLFWSRIVLPVVLGILGLAIFVWAIVDFWEQKIRLRDVVESKKEDNLLRARGVIQREMVTEYRAEAERSQVQLPDEQGTPGETLVHYGRALGKDLERARSMEDLRTLEAYEELKRGTEQEHLQSGQQQNVKQLVWMMIRSFFQLQRSGGAYHDHPFYYSRRVLVWMGGAIAVLLVCGGSCLYLRSFHTSEAGSGNHFLAMCLIPLAVLFLLVGDLFFYMVALHSRLRGAVIQSPFEEVDSIAVNAVTSPVT